VCFAEWLRISSDVSCETLIAHPFVDVAFGGMQAGSPIFDACVNLVCELLYTAQDAGNLVFHNDALGWRCPDADAAAERSVRFAALAQVVIPRVMDLQPFYAAVLAGGVGSENEACGFSRVFVELAETQMDLLASGTAEALQIAELILACTRHPNAEISKLTFNVWYNLKTRLTVADTAEAKAQFRPIFVQLVDVLIVLLRYSDTNDLMRRKAFRKTVQDVVCDACEVIGASAVLERLWASLQQEHPKLTQDPSQWHGVEAALYGVRCMVKYVAMGSRRSEGDVLPQILQLIPTLSVHDPAARGSLSYSAILVLRAGSLHYTATLVIGACADWLNGMPELLPAVFPYLVNCLSLRGVKEAAALSVKNGATSKPIAAIVACAHKLMMCI